jgi:LPXTG-site transpeptidase (sortase) family protein
MVKIKIYINKFKNSMPFALAVIISLLGLWLFIQSTYDLVQSNRIREPYVKPSIDTNSDANNSDVSRSEVTISNSSSISDTNEQVTNSFIELRHNSTKDELYTSRPEEGTKFAKLSIPKLNITLPIYEGTTKEDLKKGVGHYSDSVFPGEKDNSILSGHRNTVFRNLDKLEKGDQLVVTTKDHSFRYQIQKIRIVDKDDKTVIVPKPRATLTLTTCYPFGYIGAAPKRYVIEAFLVS